MASNGGLRALWLGGGIVVAGLGCAIAGCTVSVTPAEYHEHVYAPPPPPPPVVDRSYPAPPPAPVAADVADEPPPYVPPPAEAYATYEADLNPYGHWVDVPTYGRCWVPNDRPAGWRPYTVGHWESTDDGWCWVAEEREADWGAVCYHYGRWYEAPSVGWVWVPGTTWGPAWVAWRSGGGYCGWAPLPPQVVVVGGGISVAVIDRYVPRDHYYFCEERYLVEPRVYTHVVHADVTIVNRTTVINNITVVNNHVVNRGVRVEEVERVTGRRIETRHIAEVRSYADVRAARAEGRPVRYEPQAIEQADRTYRARVDARVAEQKASLNERNYRRATAAEADHTAERERSNARSTAADQARDAARDRANARTTAADQQRDAARDRANAKTNAADQERNAARERANDRATAADQQRDAAKERANAKTNAAEQERAAARDRANDRAAAQSTERERSARRADEQQQQQQQQQHPPQDTGH